LVLGGLSDSSNVAVSAGATYQLGADDTIRLLDGAGAVNLGSYNLTAGDNRYSSTFSGVMYGTGALTKAGSGTLTLSGANTYTGNTTISAGTLRIGDNGATGSISSNNITNNANLTFHRSDATTYEGMISGTGNVTKSSTGTLTLSGNNTYTGTTTISAGTLQIGAGGTSGAISSSSNITNNANLVFNRSDATTYGGLISGTGNVTKSATGTLTLSGNNTYTGSTTLAGGTLSLGSALAIGTSGNISFSGGSLQFTANNTTDYSSRFSQAANQAYAIDTNGQNISLASDLSSSNGSLAKQGAGTLTLSGNNTYTGSTTVSAGTLNVNGSTSASSSFTVASGATLGGNGTIGGDTTIYGIHSPGNSPGIQTFTGNLTYDTSGGSIPTVNWQLSGNTDTDFSAFDQIVVGGNLAFNTATSLVLDFSGYGDVDWADPFWTSDQSWVIYDVAGTTTGANNFSIATANWADNSGDSFNTLLSASSFSLGQQGNDLVLSYTAGTASVPEPSQVAASLLALIGLGIYLWRKKHAAQASRLRS
jgi:autotransporter-associated beta strand protein